MGKRSRLIRLFRFRHWTDTMGKAGRLLLSRRVPRQEKLLFLIPVGLYWVLPDVLPLLPVDDAAVTLLLANWFVGRWERKHVS